MIVWKKSLHRRTFLRGVGASMALPLLDAMVPALKAERLTAAAPVRRMGVVFVPNAVIMDRWLPTKVGPDFEFKPIMSPLAPFRDRIMVLSGLSCEPDKTQVDDHGRALAGWLTGVEASKTETRVGISADQIAARELGKQTQFASLELSAERTPVGISYKTPTTPLPVETNPRVMFERLFGDGDSIDPKAMAAHNREDRSILDLVSEDISGLSRTLGPADRRKLDEYLESIRDIERRIEVAEQRMSNVEVPQIARPAGVPDLYPDYVKLMFDLQVVALQADLTRVWTFMLGREASVMTYNHIGIPDAHHEITHHAGHQEKIEGVTKINTHHVDLFGYLLTKMQAAKEAGGSLLDHSLVLYGSDMSDGNHHNQHNLPLVLAGGAAGRVQGNRHIQYPLDTPMSNLLVTMLDKVGVHTDKLGDSTGRLEHLWDI